jgi:septal ring factor EnvC (AmiA/AmiB activator)
VSPAPDERERITAAMARTLSGCPEHSNGALTILALAQEAGVPRNALTQRHLDMKSQFYEHVKERGATSDVELRLRATITALKKTIASNNEELAQLRADVPALVRVINQLSAENLELRVQLEMPAASIVPIRRGDRQQMPPSP